jgi:hypothetical protein
MAKEFDLGKHEIDLIPIRKAARMCGFKGSESLRRAIDLKELPAFKLNARVIVVPRVSLIRWIKEHRLREPVSRNLDTLDAYEDDGEE